MIPTDVIKLVFYLFFIFYLNKTFSQEIKKETIYILFKKNEGKFDSSLGKKFVAKKSLNFNLYKNYFAHYKNLSRDTLCLFHLKNYKLTDEKNIEKKANLWREKNKEKLKKKYGMLYRQGAQYKNNIFEVFIIEKINSEQMVIYEVKFRNEGAIK